MDFLGMVNFFDHRILRTKTKKRMLRKIKEKKFLTARRFDFGRKIIKACNRIWEY